MGKPKTAPGGGKVLPRQLQFDQRVTFPNGLPNSHENFPNHSVHTARCLQIAYSWLFTNKCRHTDGLSVLPKFHLFDFQAVCLLRSD